MINLLICGANGRMGKKVYEAVCLDDNIAAVCGIDRFEDFSNPTYPVYDSFDKVDNAVDVIIDFSSPASLYSILTFATAKGIPCILCSTGYTEEHVAKVTEASKRIALFRSANMSLGVNAILDLVKKAALSLYGFDIEIIEKHHHNKVDAPSGTALMLADAVKETLPEKFYVYGREGIVGKRNADEIGIHAVRGGNIVGEHDVIFAGESETVTISHQATDRAVFAQGAITAAKFIIGKKPGLYSMKDVLNAK